MMTLFPSLCLALVATAIFASPGKAADSPLQLDVTVSEVPSRTISISCSLDPTLTSMQTVDELKIYGSKPNSKKDDFQSLASVDRWNTNPHLFSGLGLDSVGLSGKFGFESKRSELTLSWTTASQISGLHYKCAARGPDGTGQMVTISETTTIETTSPQFTALVQKMDLLTEQFNKRLSDMEGRIAAVKNTLTTNADKFQSFRNALNQMESNFSKFEDTIKEMAMTTEFHSTAIKLLDAEEDFKVAKQIFRDQVYMGSREAEYFDIYSANRRCMSYGGYLAEINDSDELEFVAKSLGDMGDQITYFIGANDIAVEGKFTYYHSMESVPDDLWGKGQPNKYKDDQDCVRINRKDGKLQAVSCDDYRVRYVCEIPVLKTD